MIFKILEQFSSISSFSGGQVDESMAKTYIFFCDLLKEGHIP